MNNILFRTTKATNYSSEIYMDGKDAETWIEDNASTIGGVILVVLVVIIIFLLVIIYRSIFNKKVNSRLTFSPT